MLTSHKTPRHTNLRPLADNCVSKVALNFIRPSLCVASSSRDSRDNGLHKLLNIAVKRVSQSTEKVNWGPLIKYAFLTVV